MPSDLPTEQYFIQGAAIAIDSLCNPLLSTYSETLSCDASVEMQEANKVPWASWSGKVGALSWLLNMNPRGVWSCVFGDLFRYLGCLAGCLDEVDIGEATPFLGWRTLVSDQAVNEETLPTISGWSLVGSCLYQSPTCPEVLLSLCLIFCPDLQMCSVSLRFFVCISLLLFCIVLAWSHYMPV